MLFTFMYFVDFFGEGLLYSYAWVRRNRKGGGTFSPESLNTIVFINSYKKLAKKPYRVSFISKSSKQNSS